MLKFIQNLRKTKWFFILFYLFNLGLLGGFCFIIYIFYLDLKSNNPTTYCYAIFVANSILSNSLFALGRSSIFIEIYKEKIIQKQIYHAATMFLVAAIISLLAATVGYLLQIYIVHGNLEIGLKLNIFILFSAILLGTSFIFIQSGINRLRKFLDLKQEMEILKSFFPKEGASDFIESRHKRPFKIGKKNKNFYNI